MTHSFHTLEYVKGAEAIGIKREHAEYQAEQLSKLIENDLITKHHLDSKTKEIISYIHSEISTVEVSLIKWIIGVCAAQVAIFLAILTFFLHH